MNSIFQYVNLEKTKGKKVVCFGSLNAREFALRLLEQDIYFNCFLFLGDDKYFLPHLMNKQIISIEQLKLLDNYVIVAAYNEFEHALQVLSDIGLEQKLVEIERIRSELVNASNIVIYGTGGRAERLFGDVDGYLNIKCFCDSNRSKTGKLFHGKQVIHAPELSDFPRDTSIIIGSTFLDEVRNSILQCGIEESRIFYMEYDLTIFPDNQHKYTYKLASLLDLIRDCRSQRVIMYGEQKLVRIMYNIFSNLDIAIEKLIERNGYEEDGTIYSLAYCDMQNTIFIIVDHYSTVAHDALEQLGLRELQYGWVENYSSFSVACKERVYQCMLDPHLGHAYKSSGEAYPGFIKYEYVNSEKVEPIKLLALGGSTTSGYGVRQKSWSECLSEVLRKNEISHVLYCGGIDSYTASQELIKLIRDGIWIKPDCIISYSGMNNMTINSKTPFVHYYQREFYDKIINFIDSSHWGIMKGINYGIESDYDSFEYWFTQINIMYAICERLGIEYKVFLQPILYSKQNVGDMDRDVAFLEGFLLDTSDRKLVAVEFNEAYNLLQKNAKHFRNVSKTIDETWFYDLSDLFDDQDGIYMDCCHVYERGNRLIAEKIYEVMENSLRK